MKFLYRVSPLFHSKVDESIKNAYNFGYGKHFFLEYRKIPPEGYAPEDDMHKTDSNILCIVLTIVSKSYMILEIFSRKGMLK